LSRWRASWKERCCQGVPAATLGPRSRLSTWVASIGWARRWPRPARDSRREAPHDWLSRMRAKFRARLAALGMLALALLLLFALLSPGRAVKVSHHTRREKIVFPRQKKSRPCRLSSRGKRSAGRERRTVDRQRRWFYRERRAANEERGSSNKQRRVSNEQRRFVSEESRCASKQRCAAIEE
jgi:hypothetical protein